MSFKDFYRYSKKGIEIADAFKGAGLTLYQARALIEVYDKKLPWREIKKLTGINNDGQFSRDVIAILKTRGYIKKDTLNKNFSMTSEGKNLVEKVMRETGYFSR